MQKIIVEGLVVEQAPNGAILKILGLNFLTRFKQFISLAGTFWLKVRFPLSKM